MYSILQNIALSNSNHSFQVVVFYTNIMKIILYIKTIMNILEKLSINLI